MAADKTHERILAGLKSGRFRTTLHAEKRMVERNVRFGDICNLGRTGKVKPADDGKYRVSGADLDGEDLTAIVAMKDGVIVVTLF